MLAGETVRVPGGPARRVRGAVGKLKWQRDVVGDAFTAHVVEERKAPALGIIQPISDFLPAAIQKRQRALPESRRIRQIEIRRIDDDLPSLPPDEAAAVSVRMQRPHEGAHPPERHARSNQPLTGLPQQRDRRSRRPRAVDQPGGEVLKTRCVHGGCICRLSSPSSRQHKRALRFGDRPFGLKSYYVSMSVSICATIGCKLGRWTVAISQSCWSSRRWYSCRKMLPIPMMALHGALGYLASKSAGKAFAASETICTARSTARRCT